jgi:dihydroorotate dehydrogenase (fumarate)
VQVVSSVYKHGVERIAAINKSIAEWMQQKGYNSLDGFRGKLANINLDKNEHSLVYKRAQYVDLMLTSETIFGNFQ